MSLYDTLGKAVLSAFFSLTHLVSPAPLPKPEAAILTPIITTPTAPSPQQKTIPIYLNYPEKISIAPIKTVDQNFKKIFLYSLEKDIENNQVSTIEEQDLRKTSPIQIINPSNPIATVTTIKNANEEKIRKSIANIYCSIKIGKSIKVITGSGAIINSKGIILTNAHVGQFPLLQGNSIAKNMNCEIRTGSPISNSYGVRVLYISKDWIDKNFRNISQINFSETGENDIALLQIVDKTTGNPINTSFDYLSLSPTTPSINNYVSIASYPADILASRGVSSLLSVKLENLRVHQSFSFSQTSEADLIETTESNTVQHGSSGGALLDNTGKLGGIIAITVPSTSPSAKHARVITLSHINNTIQKDTGKNIEDFFLLDTSKHYNENISERNTLSKRLIDGSAALFFQQ